MYLIRKLSNQSRKSVSSSEFRDCKARPICYAAAVKLSVKSDYATRAVLGMARHYPTGKATRVEDLAAQEGVPANYLVQILIELKAQGIGWRILNARRSCAGPG